MIAFFKRIRFWRKLYRYYAREQRVTSWEVIRRTRRFKGLYWQAGQEELQYETQRMATLMFDYYMHRDTSEVSMGRAFLRGLRLGMEIQRARPAGDLNEPVINIVNNIPDTASFLNPKFKEQAVPLTDPDDFKIKQEKLL